MVVMWLAISPDSRMLLSLILVPLYVEFKCLSCACEGLLKVLWFPSVIQRHAH